jgi:outer membrane receptor for ferrienterochelin and colicins
MTAIRKAAICALLVTSCMTAPAVAFAQAQPAEETTLEELVVTGQITYRNRTETVAPELTYDQEFFERFEPVSVGDQLKRVPGVAFTSDIGEYDSPQLRGLGQGFTQVLVNGRPIPGAGNDRTVFVDRIPAEIVDRIEIIRSPSADIDSQGVGGTINIILKNGESLPPGVIARAGVNYDVDMKEWSPSAAVSVSGRNEAETVLYSFTLDAQRRFNNKHTIQEVFEDDSVGFDDEVARGGDGSGLVQFFNPSKSQAVERVEEEDSRRSTDLSFNGDLIWRPRDGTMIRVDGFFLSTRREEQQDTFIYEGDGTVGGLDLGNPEYETQEADFNQDSYGASALFEQELGENLKFESQLRFNRFTDDSVESTFSEDAGHELLETSEIDATDTEWTLDGALKGKLPGFAEALGWDSVGFKIGGAYKTKERDYGLLVGDDLDDVGEEKFSDGQFLYEERRFDVFAVLEMNFSSSLKGEIGVRAESTETEQTFRSVYTNNEDGYVITDSGSVSGDEFEINPSAHLVWELTGNDQIRFSAARTVRRPSIDQLVPAVTRESPGDDDATIGNPGVGFETSVGFDLGYETRFAGQGVFGINFFRRDISNLIGLTGTGADADSVPAGNDLDGQLYTYTNLGDAKVWGVELDISTPLSFIGLEETGIFANYTRLWSEREDLVTGKTVSVDYQPDYVYNFGVTQNLPSWDASFGFSYQRQGKSTFYTLGEIETQVYDANLEIFLEKRIGERVVIRLSGNNLLDSRSRQTERGYDGDDGEEIADNQRINEVDAFEVEHEESSPTILFTVRAVF